MNKYVGPFFCIDNNIIGLKLNINNAATNTSFINHPKSHFDFFNERLSYLDGDYGNYPRGRIIYNKSSNKFYLYLDKTLFNKKEIINEIKKYYNLTRSSVVIKKDEHYTFDDF